jgi:tRNA (guanine26-N2/guanine27-N2)-dimethyltransferase
LIRDEVEAPPTYYVIDKISNKLTLPVPSVTEMLKILREQGYETVPTHFRPLGIKTDAPAIEMQKLLRVVVDTATRQKQKT